MTAPTMRRGPNCRRWRRRCPGTSLQDSLPDLVRRLTDKPVELAELSVALQSQSVVRAAVKYGREAHTARMVERIRQAMGDRPYEVR